MRMMTTQVPKTKRYDTFFYIGGPKVKVVNFSQFLKENRRKEALNDMNSILVDRESSGFRWGGALSLLESAIKS